MAIAGSAETRTRAPFAALPKPRRRYEIVELEPGGGVTTACELGDINWLSTPVKLVGYTGLCQHRARQRWPEPR